MYFFCTFIGENKLTYLLIFHCSYEKNYTAWAVLMANDFHKMDGRPKSETPK